MNRMEHVFSHPCAKTPICTETPIYVPSPDTNGSREINAVIVFLVEPKLRSYRVIITLRNLLEVAPLLLLSALRAIKTRAQHISPHGCALRNFRPTGFVCLARSSTRLDASRAHLELLPSFRLHRADFLVPLPPQPEIVASHRVHDSGMSCLLGRCRIGLSTAFGKGQGASRRRRKPSFASQRGFRCAGGCRST